MPSTPSSADDARRPSRRAVILLAICSIVLPLGGLALVLALDDDNNNNNTKSASAPAGVSEPGKAEVGSPAPDFELAALDGTNVRLSDYRGRAVVLTFFASWCYPCEQEMPLLENAVEEHRDELGVLAVSYKDLRRDSEAFVERLGVTYPALFDTNEEVADAYGVRGIPQTFFIDADGVIRDRVFGITTERALDEPLQALLTPPT